MRKYFFPIALLCLCLAMLAACNSMSTLSASSFSPPQGFTYVGAAKTSWGTGSTSGHANRTSVINELATYVKVSPDNTIQELLIQQTLRLSNSSWKMSPAKAKKYLWGIGKNDINSEHEFNKAIATLLRDKGYKFDNYLNCGATFFKNTPKRNIFVHYCSEGSLIPDKYSTDAEKEKYLVGVARKEFNR